MRSMKSSFVGELVVVDRRIGNVGAGGHRRGCASLEPGDTFTLAAQRHGRGGRSRAASAWSIAQLGDDGDAACPSGRERWMCLESRAASNAFRGNWSSRHLISCRHRTSGFSRLRKAVTRSMLEADRIDVPGVARSEAVHEAREASQRARPEPQIHARRRAKQSRKSVRRVIFSAIAFEIRREPETRPAAGTARRALRPEGAMGPGIAPAFSEPAPSARGGKLRARTGSNHAGSYAHSTGRFGNAMQP